MNYIKNKIINIEPELFLCLGDCINLEFTIPIKENGIQLYNENYQYYFVAQNNSKKRKKYEAIKIVENEEDFIATWAIDRELTSQIGEINFSFLIEHNTDNTKDFIYSSLISKIEVRNTLVNKDLNIDNLEDINPNTKINGSNLIDNSVSGKKLIFDFLNDNFKVEDGKIVIDNLDKILGNNIIVSEPEGDTDEEGNYVPSQTEANTLFWFIADLYDYCDSTADTATTVRNAFGAELGRGLYQSKDILNAEKRYGGAPGTLNTTITVKDNYYYVCSQGNISGINISLPSIQDYDIIEFDTVIYFDTHSSTSCSVALNENDSIYWYGTDIVDGQPKLEKNCRYKINIMTFPNFEEPGTTSGYYIGIVQRLEANYLGFKVGDGLIFENGILSLGIENGDNLKYGTSIVQSEDGVAADE